MGIKSYRDLQVWQMAMEMTDEVFHLLESLPCNERFELRSQLNRAAISVPSNIAEGWGRRHPKEYIHHLSMAYGSLMEVETQIEIALRRKYFTEERLKRFQEFASRTGQMLNRLMQSLERNSGIEK